MAKRKKKNKVLHAFGTAFKITFLILLILIVVGGTIFYFKYGRTILELQAEAKELVADSTVDTFKESQTSVVYDDSGNVLLSLSGEKDLYYLEYEDIPNYVKQAMISIEDKNFTTHSGVDYTAIVRAAVAYVKNGFHVEQGGSTITQQLAKNVFLTNAVTWTRKVEEIFIAMEMEKKYSKYQILEFYLNNIYFGNGYYGIQAASKGYFNTTVDELSLSQIAYLCAIPNNPTLYDPINNSDNTIKRRNRILKQMVSDGWIEDAEYQEAVNEEITLNIVETTKKNYVTTYVLYSATRALMESNGFEFQTTFDSDEEEAEYDEQYTELYNECQKSLYTGGYQIYTSINQDKQQKLQESVDDALSGFTDKTDDGVYDMQGSAVSIDNETGLVVAIVGGRSQESQGYTLNRAFQSYRQPGSSIKPLIVYTPAFELGYTPSSYVVDEQFDGGPRNADGTYSGTMSILNAVAKSKNTVAWKLFETITPKVGLSYLLNMNFQKIVDEDYTAATGIGGFTYGVSAVEMASGFAAIENGGVYREATCISKITDADGNIIMDENDTVEKTVYQENATKMMISCLEEVMNSGTGASLKLSNMTCAGKTGTTNDKKDGWFVGFTPYYTTAVWVGCDTPKSVSDLTGASYPGTIWKTYMEWANEGLDVVEFDDYYTQPSTSKNEENATASEDEEDTTQEDTEEEVEEDTGEDDTDATISPSPEASKDTSTDKNNNTTNNNDSTVSGGSEDNSIGYGGDDTAGDDPDWDEDENDQDTGQDTSGDTGTDTGEDAGQGDAGEQSVSE